MGIEENVLPERELAYIDWLCTAPALREPSTKTGYAQMLGVADSTITRWEKKDLFKREWAKRVDDTVGSPERTKGLLDSLYERAMAGDVPAAKLYFTVTGKMTPAPMTVNVQRGVGELSDAELDGLIAGGAASELEARRNT